MRVEQFQGVANQFRIITDDAIILQSYSSIIVKRCRKTGAVTLGKNWNHSATTGKYRNLFLNETKKETEKKIKEGVYTIDENL